MSGAAIEVGDKLHIMTRRLFEDDIRRHFAGEVTAISDSLIEARGYTFIFHSGINEYRRLPERRTRLFALGDAGHVVNKIPREIDIESIAYKTVENRQVITDGRSYSLPINEFGPSN